MGKMIVFFFLIVFSLWLMWLFVLPETERPLQPIKPPPEDCINNCVWAEQHNRFVEGREQITRRQFNRLTLICTERCNRAYDESFALEGD